MFRKTLVVSFIALLATVSIAQAATQGPEAGAEASAARTSPAGTFSGTVDSVKGGLGTEAPLTPFKPGVDNKGPSGCDLAEYVCTLPVICCSQCRFTPVHACYSTNKLTDTCNPLVCN